MRKYALIDQFGTILSYSDFPIKSYTLQGLDETGQPFTNVVNCVADIVYNPEYVGKTYDVNIKEVLI